MSVGHSRLSYVDICWKDEHVTYDIVLSLELRDHKRLSGSAVYMTVYCNGEKSDFITVLSSFARKCKISHICMA